jgi:hypothetical protein
MDAPTAPEVGLKLVSVGVESTVKDTPLVSTPLACTTTFPVVAPLGTGTAMLVALQLVGVAVVPLNLIVLLPCVAPKSVPVTVTDAPTAPEVRLRLVIAGVGRRVNVAALVSTPLAWTITLPVVAPVGTGTTMLVAPQLVGDAAVPLKATVLAP